jgi:hypothetical protein
LFAHENQPFKGFKAMKKLQHIILFVLLFAVACFPLLVFSQAKRLEFSPNEGTLNFGTKYSLGMYFKTLTLTNAGSEALHLSLSLGNSDGSYALVASSQTYRKVELVLQPQEKKDITVLLNAQTTGLKQGAIVLIHDATNWGSTIIFNLNAFIEHRSVYPPLDPNCFNVVGLVFFAGAYGSSSDGKIDLSDYSEFAKRFKPELCSWGEKPKE